MSYKKGEKKNKSFFSPQESLISLSPLSAHQPHTCMCTIISGYLFPISIHPPIFLFSFNDFLCIFCCFLHFSSRMWPPAEVIHPGTLTETSYTCRAMSSTELQRYCFAYLFLLLFNDNIDENLYFIRLREWS